MDLIVRNARLRGRERLYDIGIENGRISEISRRVSVEASREVDAGGKLVLPAYIEPHIHLDKVLTAETVRVNKSGTLREAIEILWDAKRRYTVDDVKGRVVAETRREAKIYR